MIKKLDYVLLLQYLQYAEKYIQGMANVRYPNQPQGFRETRRRKWLARIKELKEQEEILLELRRG